MEVKKSNYIVKAIHTFQTDEPGELPLTIDDIVQVTRTIDKFWLHGYSNGREGNFPAAFTTEIELKEDLSPESKLFASLASFQEQEPDDLGFERGEIIIGLSAVDSQWWRGRRVGETWKEGIFPLTHVWEMDKSLLPKAENDSSLSSSTSSSETIQYAIADYDLKPEIPEEIPLRKGDRVKILGSHDRMYFKGESDGVFGIFPKRFVTIIQENSSTVTTTPPATNTTEVHGSQNHQQLQSQPIYENDPVPTISVTQSFVPITDETQDLPPSYEESIRSDDSTTAVARNLSFDGVQSYAKVLYPFVGQREGELTISPGEIIHLIQYVDAEENWILGEIDGRIGMFPKNFVQVIVDCMDRKKAVSLVSFDYPPDTYGRVVYSFNAEFEGELSVKEGTIVTLTRGFNSDWVEIVDDTGIEGIIPLNHVEVIESSPSSSSQPHQPSIVDQASRPNANLMEFSPDEPDASQLATEVKNLSITSASSVPSASLSTVTEETTHRLNSTPTQPSLTVPRYPSSSSINVDKTSPSPVPSPRTSSLGLPPSPSPHVPIRTSSALRLQATTTPPLPPPPPHIPSLQSSSFKTGQLSAEVNPASNVSVIATPSTASGSSVNDSDRTEARRKKMMEQRSCIVTEMLQSERDYCQDLRVCAKTFILDARVKNGLTEKGVILESLFCNLDEIIGVSEKLTRSLEESTLCRKPENQMIGKCFLSLEEEMKQAYIVYCRDHEDVPIAWKRYEENPEIKVILQKGLDRIKSETNCFDVPSLLIKPVQRILKYPLLLNELLKCTDETHPDREDIIKAANMITDMAQDINELKRRKDLVFKYRKGTNSSFSSKISKLNFHTVMKKSSRFGQRLTTTLGFSPVLKDEKFEEEANKFKVIEKTIKIFLKDLTCFIESMQEFVDTCFQLAEAVASFYADKCTQPDVEQFRTSQRLLKTDLWDEMKVSLEARVIAILEQLLRRFQNPSKLIEKRYDKLLDFDAATKKVEGNKDPSKQRILKEEQNMAKNNYEALNSQLLDELPLFTARTIEIIQGCVHAQIKIKKIFLAKITEEMMKLLDLPSMLGSSSPLNSSSILETFQIKYNLVVDQMIKDFDLVPANIFPNASVSNFSGTLDRRCSKDMGKKLIKGPTSTLRKPSISLGQSEADRHHIENVYKGHIYRVTRDYETTELAGVSVRKDDLVGVIKYKDPSGNCHRWFVDNASEKGFIPENILIPCPGTLGPNSNLDHPHNLPNHNGLTEINLPFNTYPAPGYLHGMSSNSVQRSNSSCSSSTISSSSYGNTSTLTRGNSSSNRTITRPAPKPPQQSTSGRNTSVQRAESFSTKSTPAPPPPLPPRSTSIDAGVYYDQVNKEITDLYQNMNLISCDSEEGVARYSNLDEFDPLAAPSSKSIVNPNSIPTKGNVNNKPSMKQSQRQHQPLAQAPHRYEDIENGSESETRYQNLETLSSHKTALSSSRSSSTDRRIPVNETWLAAYPFNPKGAYQVSLQRGTSVLVLHKSDLNGNAEWWYIRNHQGSEGYVPANYLTSS